MELFNCAPFIWLYCIDHSKVPALLADVSDHCWFFHYIVFNNLIKLLNQTCKFFVAKERPVRWHPKHSGHTFCCSAPTRRTYITACCSSGKPPKCPPPLEYLWSFMCFHMLSEEKLREVAGSTAQSFLMDSFSHQLSHPHGHSDAEVMSPSGSKSSSKHTECDTPSIPLCTPPPPPPAHTHTHTHTKVSYTWNTWKFPEVYYNYKFWSVSA